MKIYIYAQSTNPKVGEEKSHKTWGIRLLIYKNEKGLKLEFIRLKMGVEGS